MLKVTPQSLLQFAPLSDFNLLDADHPPSKWCGDWVSRRWVEGLKTLRLIPLKGMSSGFKKAWPPYLVEWEDLLAQQEQGELEATQHEQNRVRLQPSYRQVTMSEAVISWPLYLADFEPVLRALIVSAGPTHASAMRRSWRPGMAGAPRRTWRVTPKPAPWSPTGCASIEFRYFSTVFHPQ
jgi:hypothetical protein